MFQDINLNLYKIFYSVAMCKSFKQASEKLHVSQPAISKQVKNLEEILGVKLFYRFNKGVELTKEGKILFDQIEKMNFYLEASVKHLSSIKDLSSGELIIGCPSHITSFYLLKYIEEFRNDYMGISVKIISDSTSILIDSLLHHKIDFIIDSFPIATNYDNLIIKPLKVFDTILIVNNNYCNSINSIDDLNNKYFVLPLSRSSMRKNFEKSLKKYNINMCSGVEVDTTDLIISSVKKNLGIGYVIKEAVLNEIENGKIKELNIDCELPKLEVSLVYIKDYISYPAKVFLEKYIKAI